MGNAEYMGSCDSSVREMFFKVILFFSLAAIYGVKSQVLEGLIALDRLSFNKIVSKREYSLIKFDVGYPTGDKHKNYGKLVNEVKKLENVFVGEVRIKDYGDKANQELAKRFNVDEDKKNLPDTILFKHGSSGIEEVVRYGGDYSLDNLRTFLSRKTGVYIQCNGCIKELDTLAEKIALAATREERLKILFAAKSWAAEKGGDSEVYVKIMTKTQDSGAEDIIKEINRVEKMMENKNSDNVKEKLTKKRNVLNSFKVRTKDEL